MRRALLALLLAGPAAAQSPDARCQGSMTLGVFSRMEGLTSFTLYARLHNQSDQPRRWSLEARAFLPSLARVEWRQSGGPLAPGATAVVRIGEGPNPDVQNVARLLDSTGLDTGPAVVLTNCAPVPTEQGPGPVPPAQPPDEEALRRRLLAP